MKPVREMQQRIESARADSDVALFYDLLLLGELVVKLMTVGLAAAVRNDRERLRYGTEFRLVRSANIGDWLSELQSLAEGPASAIMADDAAQERRDLTQKFGTGDDSWQRVAHDKLILASTPEGQREQLMQEKKSLLQALRTFPHLRNATKGHGAPSAADCARMSTALDAALDAIVENYSAFLKPWAYIQQTLQGKYRVSTITVRSDAFQDLTRDRDFNLPNGVYRDFNGQLLAVPLVYTDESLTDFYLANGCYSEGKFETLSYVTGVKKDIIGNQYSTPPSRLPASVTGSAPIMDITGQTFTNLPNLVDGYIERPDLQAELEKVLLDDRHPIVTMKGPGGAGKTSTTLRTLSKIAHSGHFVAIFWLSARDVDLSEHGPQPVKPDILDESDVADQYLRLWDPDNKERSGTRRIESFRSALSTSDGPFLFVFDNYETVRDGRDLYATLDAYIRLPNKILITTRDRSFKADWPIEVGGMQPKEFNELVLSLGAKLGLESRLSNKVLDALFDESGGHPYIARILLGEMYRNGEQADIKRVLSEREDILNALFERTYTSLNAGTQRVFLTLSAWRSTIPRVALEAAILREKNERIDIAGALETLEKTSLIQISEGEDGRQQFLSVPLAAHHFAERKLKVHGMYDAIKSDVEILRLFGATRTGREKQVLEPRVRRLANQIAERASSGHDVSDGLEVLEYVAGRYTPAWLIVADLAAGREDFEKARESVEHYLEHHPDDLSQWLRLASICAQLGDYLGELAAYTRRASSLQAGVVEASEAANKFNFLLGRGLHALDQDSRKLRAAPIRAALERNIKLMTATDYSRLAWVCLNVGDKEAALNYANRGNELDPTNEHIRNLIERLSGF